VDKPYFIKLLGLFVLHVIVLINELIVEKQCKLTTDKLAADGCTK